MNRGLVVLTVGLGTVAFRDLRHAPDLTNFWTALANSENEPREDTC